MRKLKKTWLLLAVSGCLLAAACAKNNPVAPSTVPDQGGMCFALSVTGSPADNIVSGKVTITKGALTLTQTRTIAEYSGSVIFQDVQVGNWSIAIQLYDRDGVEIYNGQGTGLVSKNQTTTVRIQVNHQTGNLEIVVEVPVAPTPTPVNNHAPGIAFVDDNATGLYTIALDGTNCRRLSSENLEIRDFNSVRHQFIVNKLGEMGAYRLNDNGGDFQLLISEWLDKVRWSRDGETIAMVPAFSPGIQCYNANGVFLSAVSGLIFHLCWAPNGKVVFTENESEVGRSGVFMSDRDGQNRETILNYDSGQDAMVIDCSPDGVLLLRYVTNTGTHQVATMNLDGTGLRVITDTLFGFGSARMSADGTKVVYTEWDLVSGNKIYVMNRDGSERHEVVTPAGLKINYSVCFVNL